MDTAKHFDGLPRNKILQKVNERLSENSKIVKGSTEEKKVETKISNIKAREHVPSNEIVLTTGECF